MTPGEYAFALFLTALVAGAGAYFGAYLRESAKQRAVEESIGRLTTTTEEIKATVSGDLWLKQKRWGFTFDLYRDLLRGVNGAAHGFKQMEAVLERQQFLAAKGAPPDEWLSRFNADNDAIIDREFERIRSAAVLAPLVVGSAATEALKGLLNIWLDAQAKKLPDTEFAPLLRAALNRAATALTIAARQDLWRDSAGPGRPEAST